MTIPIISTANNPITGTFGTGQVRMFAKSGTWYRPPGINAVRVRMWGAGGGYVSAPGGGSGGGFAMKTIYDLGDVTSVAVQVGVSVKIVMANSIDQIGTNSMFGDYVFAQGGGPQVQYSVPLGGYGDIVYQGGTGSGVGGGGGAANLFGPGGNSSFYNGVGTVADAYIPSSGSSGGGGGAAEGTYGGNGMFGTGGRGFNPTAASGFNSFPPVSTMPFFSIDFLGAGPGGGYYQAGINGGGGGYVNSTNANYFPVTGGFPGGGGGGYGAGADGLVIVEF